MNTTASDLKYCVGKGWWPLLSQLDAELTVICPDYNVIQVKEKFGDLRVYLDSDGYPDQAVRKKVYEAIAKYEKLSSQTCELCGEPGKHTQTAWVKTLCEQCNQNPKRIV